MSAPLLLRSRALGGYARLIESEFAGACRARGLVRRSVFLHLELRDVCAALERCAVCVVGLWVGQPDKLLR